MHMLQRCNRGKKAGKRQKLPPRGKGSKPQESSQGASSLLEAPLEAPDPTCGAQASTAVHLAAFIAPPLAVSSKG